MKQISTRDMSGLPEIHELIRHCQSLATLDAILSPNWDSRYYSFNSKWAIGEMMGSMRNGCGDEFFILFSKAGAAIKGFAHESAMSPYASGLKPAMYPGIVDTIPPELKGVLFEPAFSPQDTTFLIWRRTIDQSWSRGNIDFPAGIDPDGSLELLEILDGDTSTYQKFAQDYFEKELRPQDIEKIYNHELLSDSLVNSISNGKTDFKDISADIAEIGYPIVP